MNTHYELLYLDTITFSKTDKQGKNNNMTKKQMALLLGMSVRSLSKIEKGVSCRKLNLNTVFDIMCLFNVSADELFNARFGDK